MELSNQNIVSTNSSSSKLTHITQHTSLDDKPLKYLFSQWINSLPTQERFLAVKIYCPKISTLIRKKIVEFDNVWNEKNNQLLEGRRQNQMHYEGSKRSLKKIERIFYDSLVFISDGRQYLDHICFQFSLLECPDKLFDILTTNVQTGSSKLLIETMKNKISIETLLQNLILCQNMQDMVIQTFNYLRQEILLRFRQSYIDKQFIGNCLEEEKRRKKEFSNHWKHMSDQNKKRILYLGGKDIQGLKKILIQKKQNFMLLDVEKQIDDLLKLDKNEFCNRIFKCKVKKCLQNVINYYELIYYNWKKQVQKYKKRKNHNKYIDKNENKQVKEYVIKKQQIKIKYIQEQQEIVENPKIIKQQIKQRNNQYISSINRKHRQRKPRKSSIQSNQTNVTERDLNKKYKKQIESIENVKQVQSIQKKVVMIQEQIKHHSIQLVQKQKQVHQIKIQKKPYHQKKKKKNNDQQEAKGGSQTTFKRKRKNQKNKGKNQQKIEKNIQKPSQIMNVQKKQETTQLIIIKQNKNPQNNNEQLTQQQIMHELNQQLLVVTDKISQQANIYHQSRVIAFQRIQYLLACYDVYIQLFGSCASGIATKHSDIDIAVNNKILLYFQYLPQNVRLHAALQRLKQILLGQICIQSVNLIGSAAVPVIKIKINTAKQFLDQNYKEIFYHLNRHHNSSIVEADITIQTLNHMSQSNHLGIISTQAINQWLNIIPSLRSIVIVMKQFFLLRGFNNTYKGGLNTFSMILLFVAYIYHAKIQNQTNCAKVLYQILTFYSQQFDQRQTGIDILNKQSNNIFFNKKQMQNIKDNRQKADLQILDPKSDRKNITRKCYSFSYIKLYFKQIKQKCFDSYINLKQKRKLKENIFYQFIQSIKIEQ